MPSQPPQSKVRAMVTKQRHRRGEVRAVTPERPEVKTQFFMGS